MFQHEKPYYLYNWLLFKAVVENIVICYKVCYEKPQENSCLLVVQRIETFFAKWRIYF